MAPQILGDGLFLVYWNTNLPPAGREVMVEVHDMWDKLWF